MIRDRLRDKTVPILSVAVLLASIAIIVIAVTRWNSNPAAALARSYSAAEQGGYSFGQAVTDPISPQDAVAEHAPDTSDPFKLCYWVAHLGTQDIQKDIPQGESIPASQMPPPTAGNGYLLNDWIIGCNSGAAGFPFPGDPSVGAALAL